MGDIAAMGTRHLSLHDKELATLREIGTIVNFRLIAHPDSPGFYASVSFVGGGEIGFGFGVFFKSRLLMSFNRVG